MTYKIQMREYDGTPLFADIKYESMKKAREMGQGQETLMSAFA